MNEPDHKDIQKLLEKELTHIGAQSYSNQQGDAQIKSLITQLGNEIIALHERKKQ